MSHPDSPHPPALASGGTAPALMLLGAGGHAKVLHGLVRALGGTITGVFDPQLAASGQTHWRGIPVLGDDRMLTDMAPATVGLINGVGQLPGTATRRTLYLRFRALGFRFPPLRHPSAWVDPSVTLGDGAQIMAGAIIQPDCSIGENTIVNTGARIDHDCRIGDHVHIAPGAVLCGGVSVGADSFIGAGSVIVQSQTLAASSIVKAAALRAHRPATDSE